MNYWNRMTIGARLASSYGLLVLLLVAVTVTSVYRIGRINDALNEILDQRYASVTMANGIEKANNDQSRFLRNALLAGKDANEVSQSLERVVKSGTASSDLTASLEKSVRTETGRGLFKAMTEKRAAFVVTRDETIRLIKEGKPDEASRYLLDQSRPPQREYQAAISAMIEYQDKMMHERGDAARADASAAIMLTLVVSAVAVALAVLMAVVITRSLTAQLGGEPAELARVVTAVADGELGVAVHVRPGDTGSVMASVAAMREQLAGVVSRVRAGSDSIATGSAQIATGNADLSQRTEQQASSLQQTAASMEQLSITVKQNAQTADDANRMAELAQAAAVTGGELVGAVVATMQDIAKSSSKVADIIGVIDGIAFQTNILALNAAVEAARAGDQGRGFAVVASEVRSLASRAAEAAREIKALIGDSVGKVGIGASQVDEAGAAMQQIVSQVQGVTQLIGAISSATAEQSTGIGQVVDAVAQLDQVTQQNAALVEQSAAASENLRHQAAELAEVVNVFKLGAGSGRSGHTMPPVAVTAVAAPRPAVGHSSSASPAPSLKVTRNAAPSRPAAPSRVSSASASAPSAPAPAPSATPAAAPLQQKAPVFDKGDDWESF